MSNVLKRSAPRPFATSLVEIPEWGGSVKVRGVPVGVVLSTGASPDQARELGILSILASTFDDEDQPFFASRSEVEALDVVIFNRLETAIASMFKPDAAETAKN